MNETQLRSICQTWSTPLYIYDSAKFSENFCDLESAYKHFYPNFSIAYSFKTNYTPAICKQVFSLGGMAEVVSGMEYKLAKKMGFSAERIIVNGPGKWRDLPMMLNDGALVMLDNLAELERAISYAKVAASPFRIGFRLNFPNDGGKNSRFGFDIDGEEIKRAIDVARNTQNLRIEGIHFHLSGARSLSAWEYRAEKMVGYANTLLTKDERKIIDLGSGMFGRMEPCLKEQFNQEIPSFAEYAAKVAAVFANHYLALPEKERPMLIVEPGTTLVANTVSYLTTVLATKKIRNRNIAIVDGSAHQVGELCKKKRLPLSVISYTKEKTLAAPVEITGYTCLEDDILYPDCAENIAEGDVIHIRNVGSYSNVLAPPFIQEGCAMVVCMENGEFRLIKRAESMEELFSTYVFD